MLNIVLVIHKGSPTIIFNHITICLLSIGKFEKFYLEMFSPAQEDIKQNVPNNGRQSQALLADHNEQRHHQCISGRSITQTLL